MASPDERPPLGPVLRHYGPATAAIAAVVLVLVGYLDLRARVEALEARATSPGAGAPLPEASEAGAADAGPPAPTTSRGPAPQWPCTGEIAQDLVRQSIGRHGPGVIACFDTRVAERPELAGTLLVRLRVASSGRVDAVHIAGIDDDALVQCVGNDVLLWEFSAPTGGDCAIVEAPFALGRR